MTIQWLQELQSWWGGLAPGAAFFFAIPFMVALAGLLAHGLRRRDRG